MIWLPGEVRRAPDEAAIEAAITDALNGRGPIIGLYDGPFEEALMDLLDAGQTATTEQIEYARQAGLRSVDLVFGEESLAAAA